MQHWHSSWHTSLIGPDKASGQLHASDAEVLCSSGRYEHTNDLLLSLLSILLVPASAFLLSMFSSQWRFNAAATCGHNPLTIGKVGQGLAEPMACQSASAMDKSFLVSIQHDFVAPHSEILQFFRGRSAHIKIHILVVCSQCRVFCCADCGCGAHRVACHLWRSPRSSQNPGHWRRFHPRQP